MGWAPVSMIGRAKFEVRENEDMLMNGPAALCAHCLMSGGSDEVAL